MRNAFRLTAQRTKLGEIHFAYSGNSDWHKYSKAWFSEVIMSGVSEPTRRQQLRGRKRVGGKLPCDQLRFNSHGNYLSSDATYRSIKCRHLFRHTADTPKRVIWRGSYGVSQACDYGGNSVQSLGMTQENARKQNTESLPSQVRILFPPLFFPLKPQFLF